MNSVAVFALGAARLNWPAGFWSDRTEVLVFALAVTALVPLSQVLVSQTGDRLRRRDFELQQKVEPFLATALIFLVRNAGADFENTGVQAFVLRRHGLRKKHQVRIAKVRLGPIPSSGITWTEGKGLIGRCWRTRKAQFADLQQELEPFESYDQAAWDALTHDTRYGLSFEEFQRLKGKYGIVAAAPIVDRDGGYLGCVTADMPPVAHPLSLPPRHEVLKSLAMAARLVVEAVRR